MWWRFRTFGWGATDGATRDEALLEARDLLRELIAATMREGKDLPEPSRLTRRRPMVMPPVPIALKAALYEAFRKAGVSKRRLARDLDVAESEVRRMLNPAYAAASVDQTAGEPRPRRRHHRGLCRRLDRRAAPGARSARGRPHRGPIGAVRAGGNPRLNGEARQYVPPP